MPQPGWRDDVTVDTCINVSWHVIIIKLRTAQKSRTAQQVNSKTTKTKILKPRYTPGKCWNPQSSRRDMCVVWGAGTGCWVLEWERRHGCIKYIFSCNPIFFHLALAGMSRGNELIEQGVWVGACVACWGCLGDNGSMGHEHWAAWVGVQVGALVGVGAWATCMSQGHMHDN
jgi:hypothetical protein